MAPSLGHHAAVSLNRGERSSNGPLPPFVLQQLIDEVRRNIPEDRRSAFLSLDKLTSYVAWSSRADETTDSQQPAADPALRSGGLAPWQARRVERFIDAHIDASIRIGDLAALVSFCSSHFCRAFRNHYGETPHSFVMRRRIAHAQRLMTTTTEPLSQIALMCGLSDQAHLSRLFRQHLGTTPSIWRRQWASECA